MKISDLVSLSSKNLSRRKGRTALTVIGVVVGTCAVIVMISLGIAASKSNEEMLQSWGDLTQIQVYGGGSGMAVSAIGGSVMAGGSGAPVQLNDEALDTFRSMAHVSAVTPYYNAWTVNGSIYAGPNNRYATEFGNVTGVFGDAMEPMGFVLTNGKWLSDTADYGKNKIPVLVTAGSAYSFHDTRKSPTSPKYMRWYGSTDAAGKPVEPFFDISSATLTLKLTNGDQTNEKTKEYQLVIVGTIQEDTSKGWWTQSGMVMRIRDMKMLEADYKALTGDKTKSSGTYDTVYVKVDSVDHVAAAEQAIKDLGYSTYSMTQIRESMQQSIAKSQMILGGLAAISLLVAALNIANTMTMAIYERTREIGVMKVLGCELGQIRAMFLIESGFIGFIGGVVGSAVSLLISLILNNMTAFLALLGGSGDLSGLLDTFGSYGGTSTTISIVPPWLVLAALGFATLIGLLSGIAPAGRAVKISALEAIRHE